MIIQIICFVDDSSPTFQEASRNLHVAVSLPGTMKQFCGIYRPNPSETVEWLSWILICLEQGDRKGLTTGLKATFSYFQITSSNLKWSCICEIKDNIIFIVA